MACPSECVIDANIWIDLHVGGLLDEAFRLSWRWLTPDVILAELKHPDPGAARRRRLQEVELTGEQVAQVPDLAARYPRPSRRDLFALVLAGRSGQRC